VSPAWSLIQQPTCPRDPEDRPRLFRAAHGAYLTDPDGADWVDLDNARGSVLLGHGDERVAEAVARAARGELGSATGWSPVLDSVLDRLSALCGGEVLSLYRTGTSAVRAVATAVQQARAEELGADRPLLLSAGYHGYDPMWWPEEEPFSVNPHGVVDTLFDLDVLRDRLRGPDAVAAVVVSPDRIHVGPEWYGTVASLAAEAGVPVVADEVKVGLRYSAGLAAPDLRPAVWIVAKAVANGAPVAAAGGDPALLAQMREVSYTSFFEPTVLAAADATLAEVATGRPQASVAEQGGELVAHARAALSEAGLPIEVAGDGHLFQFVCSSAEVEDALVGSCADQRLLLYAGDNQAPSAALHGDALADACGRLSRACAALAGRWDGLAIGEDARYTAAFHVMDGLLDRPRTPARTAELASRFWGE